MQPQKKIFVAEPVGRINPQIVHVRACSVASDSLQPFEL